MTQPDLLELLELLEPEPPQCRMCARPARWLHDRQVHAAYCGGRHCDNRERICQRPGCGKTFVRGAADAGTKYCSPECKVIGYRPRVRTDVFACAWCRKRNPNPRNNPSEWPYICADCIDPIRHVADRLRAHHVPHERARQLIDDPSCEICGANLLAKVRLVGHGHPTAQLVVDHDHACCPSGSRSCGKCVRGLLCAACNVAIGLLRDEAKHARVAADYLERWRTRAAPGFSGTGTPR